MLLIASLLCFGTMLYAANKVPTFVPQPESVVAKTGHFVLSKKTKVFVPQAYLKDLRPYIHTKFQSDYDLKVQVLGGHRTPSSNYIFFEKVKGNKDEAYTLDISPERVLIQATNYAGFFDALQTLRQAIERDQEQYTIPCMVIKDAPRFAFRGIMLDVSRHFQTKEFVKKQIDILSSYKINKFHWHLTDDQGWRIEIKKYPNLTAKGAWRADRTGITWWQRTAATAGESKVIGGYYTQEDIKEVVEFARIRNVEVIPEIDVPGHSKALIASYPELTCFDTHDFEVATGGKAPNNALCAGNDTVFDFLDDVFTEVARLFPGQYIHIGGDECNKTNWKKCPKCQQRIKDNDLNGEEELQSYFVQRINKIITSKHKKMIGWDEILSGKGAKGATIMAWRAWQKPDLAAPRGGYPTIMTNFHHTYFCQLQGPKSMEPEGPGATISLSTAYSYEPVPAELTAQEKTYVLGTEACMWAEFLPSEAHYEYMMYPRMLALAEVAWTQPALKNWDRFQEAVVHNFDVLKKNHVAYSTSMYTVYGSFALDELTFEGQVYLNTETTGNIIRYTTDNTVPTAQSEAYDGVFIVKSGRTVQAGLFNPQGELLGKITVFKVIK